MARKRKAGRPKVKPESKAGYRQYLLKLTKYEAQWLGIARLCKPHLSRNGFLRQAILESSVPPGYEKLLKKPKAEK